MGVTELNKLNKKLGEALLARDVFLTQTIMPADGTGKEGLYCLRFALGGYRTEDEDVSEAWEKVLEEGAKLLRN